VTSKQGREAAFRDIERLLDGLLVAAQPTLAALGVEVLDESDRGGRDGYSWSHLFDWARGESPIRRVWVRVNYSEPWEAETTVRMKVRSRVEVFRRGLRSDFVHDTEETLSLNDLIASGLGEVVQRLIDDGRQVLERGPDPAVIAERARAEAAALRNGDWEFYSKLGSERPSVHCRTAGCAQGAIAHSVFCRACHFERIMGRPCPFEPDEV